MTAVEKIKREIKKLPDENLEEIDRYIHILKQRKTVKTRLPSFHLHGQFDNISIREHAYE